MEMNPGHFWSYCTPNTLEDLIVGKKKKKKKKKKNFKC